jgi:hypothetical protein
MGDQTILVERGRNFFRFQKRNSFYCDIGYRSFASAARFTASDATALYNPHVMRGFSWPTMSADVFSETPAFSSSVTTVFLIE